MKIIGCINVTSDHQLIYESESNRSSRIFERSNTYRINLDNGQIKLTDAIRVTSLKDLLRLFRINLVIVLISIYYK